MKYYDHEEAYRRLLVEGEACWDRTAFDAFFMRPWLEEALARIALPAGSRVLELGCGSGPIACFLAARGHDVLGIDYSATAIAMARRHARERGLAIRFEVGDVLALEDDAPFELVVDGHCLHCIVHDDDRRRVYAGVYRLLAATGAFVLETMARHPDLHFDDPPGRSFHLDDEGVLWSQRDSRRTPVRRILSADALGHELRGAGFSIALERADRQAIAREPINYRAVLQRA